jgi:hypothetical protein
MGKNFNSNSGRAVGYDLQRGGGASEEFENVVSGGLVDGDGDAVEKLGFHQVWWPNVVITLNYTSMHEYKKGWREMTRAEKDAWNAVRKAERDARNRLDRRQHSINAFSVKHQEAGCDTKLAYDRAVESRKALDFERFSVLARRYAAWLDCVTDSAISKRISRDDEMLDYIHFVFIEDGRKVGIFHEEPFRWGTMMDRCLVDRLWREEPMESVVKSRRSDSLRRYWLAFHAEDYYEAGNLWPDGCVSSPEDAKAITEMAKMLVDAGIEIGPEGPMVWGN